MKSTGLAIFAEGTDNIEKLSPSEKMKILCGKKHFEQFSDVTFKAPVVKLEEILS